MLGFLKLLFGSGSSIDLGEIMASKPFVVDVRTPGEFSQGHAKGAVNIPLDKISANIQKFKNKPAIVVCCRSGNRSGQAKAILESSGIDNVHNGGTWQNVAQYSGK
jgi:phage shock protein E